MQCTDDAIESSVNFSYLLGAISPPRTPPPENHPKHTQIKNIHQIHPPPQICGPQNTESIIHTALKVWLHVRSFKLQPSIICMPQLYTANQI